MAPDGRPAGSYRWLRGGRPLRHGTLPGGWLPFIAVFLVFIVYLSFSNYDRFYFDANAYWSRGGEFGSKGHFSLFNYPDPRRGYSFPLALGGLRAFAGTLGLSPLTIVRLANAVLVAFLGTQLAPRLALRIFPAARVTVGRILALNALILIFWGDYLNFPLADFPALTLACAAVLLALHSRWYALAASGFLAGIALNTRPAYTLVALLVVVLAATRARKQRAFGRWGPVAAAALVTAGTVVALAPQIAINIHNFDARSPFPPENQGLALLQLSVGLHVQKYETVVDPARASPGVYFLDPATRAALEESSTNRVRSYASYLRIAANHPIALGGGYLRRAFNGLDVQYRSPYIRGFETDRNHLRSLLMYSLLFAAGATLMYTRRLLGGIDWRLIGLLLLPALTAVPGAVETRFFLPVHLMVYLTVCFASGVPAVWRSLGPGRKGGLVLAYGGFVIACFLLSAATYSHVGRPTDLPGGFFRPL